MFRTPIVAILLLLTPSCMMGRASQNEPFPEDALRSLQPGRTKALDIVQKLGAPAYVARLHEGSAYLYEHSQAKASGLFLLVINFGNVDSRPDRIWVFFDDKDVLTHVSHSFSSKRVEFAMPWEDLHDEIPGREDEASSSDEEGARASSDPGLPSDAASR